jgi:hypothetical protein
MKQLSFLLRWDGAGKVRAKKVPCTIIKRYPNGGVVVMANGREYETHINQIIQ